MQILLLLAKGSVAKGLQGQRGEPALPHLGLPSAPSLQDLCFALTRCCLPLPQHKHLTVACPQDTVTAMRGCCERNRALYFALE